MPKRTISSEDGIDYNVLETPGNVTFTGVHYSCARDSADAYTFHHCYIKCSQVREHALPLEANPREPRRGDVVKDMEETLRLHPSKFHHWNNGITVVCDKFTYDEASSTIELEFQPGSGVCNGGHTYFSISTFPTALADDCLVHVEFIELPDGLSGTERKNVINDIATRRNRNRQLLPTTQADYLGYYQPFKAALNGHCNLIRWHEGDSNASADALNSELLIRMIACLDPLWFYHPLHAPTKNNHKQAATSSASIHKQWFEGVQNNDPECNLKHMALLTLEILKVAEIVSGSLRNDDFSQITSGFRKTSFFQWLKEGGSDRVLPLLADGRTGLNLPNPATVLFLGSFRSNIWLGKDDNGSPTFIGVLIDFNELWNQAKCELLGNLTNLFDDCGRDPNHFIKSNAPYDNQLIKIVYGRKPPLFPQWFFEVSTGKRYELAQTGATHKLTCDEQGFAAFFAVEGIADRTEATYKEVVTLETI